MGPLPRGPPTDRKSRSPSLRSPQSALRSHAGRQRRGGGSLARMSGRAVYCVASLSSCTEEVKKNRWDVTVGRSAARSLARDENDDTDCSSAKKTGKNKKENPPPAKQNRDTRRGEIDTRVHCRRRVVENVGPGGVVVRASAWGTRGRGFESDPGRVGYETYGTYCSSAGHSACESESVVGD